HELALPLLRFLRFLLFTAEPMRVPRAPHSWRLTPKQAIALQREMSGLVCRSGSAEGFRFVAGLDGAFSPDGSQCIAGVVLWDLQERRVAEQHTATAKLSFPYIPGLLSFREIPAWVAALRKLRQAPDVLMCDGQGIAHPRRFGIASHLGVICGLPAAGCAKSRLVGTHDEPAVRRGGRAPLRDKDEIIGTVLRTQTGINPVFVSVGHRLGLASAEAMVLECALKYRLPEPTRLADRLVAAAKASMHLKKA
ncbi:MAG TPA: deoxyribonuclease V, partial [Dongiaceae bacterium]|nr:deoxyribonuclease V [Dongiaceae bacterium]